MEPITQEEMYLAAAAGEYSGELPEPKTRLEYYLKKIKEAVENGSSVAPEDIDAAIEAYLNSHDADIVTEQELSDALAGYYDKGDMDTALAGKAAASHEHDERYYTETEVDTLLSGKADTGHSHAVTDVTGLESALSGKAAASHEHDDRYYTETEIDTLLSGKAAASHSHDDRYYTESEVDTALAGKAAASHAHDDRYYTETEIDNKLGEKSNTGHTHDDRYYTEDETDTLLSGKADSSDIPDVSSFITKAVNDLTNYYTKSETYTQAEIDNMVSAIPKFAIEVVQALPLQDISPTTVYLLTVQSGQQGNMYDEYIHVGNSWELLGTQTVDLSGYYTSAQVDALLSGLPVAGHTHDERYYTESEIDGKIQTINTAISGKAASDHTHDDRYYTETEIDNKLGEKSNTGHSHVPSDVTGLDTALAGKAPASHSHAQSDITDLDTALAGKAAANHNHSGVYAPASHTHTKSQITDLSSLSAASGGTDTSLCTTGEKHTWNSKMSYKVLRNTRASMGSSGYFALDEMSSDESLIDYLYVDLIVLISNDGYQTVRMYKNAAGNGFYKTRCIMLGGVSSGATSVNVVTGAFTWNSENPRQLYYTLTREQSAYGVMVDRVIGYK